VTLGIGQNPVLAEVHRIDACHERSVAGDVFGSAQPMRARRVEVAAVLQVLKIHDLRHVVRTAVGAREDAIRERAAERAPELLHLRASHRLVRRDGIVRHPWRVKLAPECNRRRISLVERPEPACRALRPNKRKLRQQPRASAALRFRIAAARSAKPHSLIGLERPMTEPAGAD
jgi:hypothetical protein